MKSVDLRLLQETSQGSLSKLREVAQGLKRKFPKVQVPSVLERSPEKDLFKATKIIEDLSETAIVDEYIDYTSRKVLGQVETSAHDGFNAIAYTHRPSSNVKEVLYYQTLSISLSIALIVEKQGPHIETTEGRCEPSQLLFWNKICSFLFTSNTKSFSLVI